MYSVSIIIPVYNAEKTLSKCLDSIIKQTYGDWKAIIVNDGSTDGSAEICNKYAKLDSRICVFHKKNGGVSSARNFAINKVETDFFVCVDSDDVAKENYLEELITTQMHFPDIFNVWCCFQTVDSQDEKEGVPHLASCEEGVSFFSKEKIMDLHQAWILQGPYCKLYHTKVVKEHKIKMREDLNLGEDMIFNLDYLRVATHDTIIVINKPLYSYVRGNKESLDQKYRENLLEIYELLRQQLYLCLKEWHSDEEQMAKYYNMCFFQYEKVLRNTFCSQNPQKFLEKLQINNMLIRDEKFKQCIEKKACFTHPLLVKAYRSENYLWVLAFDLLAKTKNFIRKVITL